MKIYKLLLIFICLLNVRLYAQQAPTITLSLKNVPLETVLSQIKKQTGITFVYNKDVLKIAGKVSVHAEKADLPTVLNQIFRNTSISYTVFDNTVVLTSKKNDDGNVSIDINFFSKGAVHGFVYDSRQEGLSSASVVIKRSHQGTITSANGEFTLEDVRTNDTLSISFIGYTTQYIPVQGRTELSVILKETKSELDQVVVQAYGVTTKRLVVGEISQVNAKDIESQPVSNPLLALQGLVPGMVVTPVSGFSNSPIRVEIRGKSSIDINTPTDPLYVIDGTPLIQPNIGFTILGISPGLQLTNSSMISGGVSPLSLLNPKDIESITVLKDAAATAMYGSRGGNGVVLITTKKGKPGATRVEITASHQINRVIGQTDMLNTSQYLKMRREALRNDGLIPTISNSPDLMLWDTTRNVNWQKELYRSVNLSSVQATVSGGSELTSFRLNGQYSSGQDISPLKYENTNKAASVAFKFDHQSQDRKFSLAIATQFGHTNATQIASPDATLLAPDAPPIFDKNGNLNFADWNAAGSTIGLFFPFTTLLKPSVERSDLLNSSLIIGYKVINGLKVSLNWGYNLGLNTNSTTVPIASQNPLFSPQGQLIVGNSRADNWNVSPQIDYSRHILKGQLTAVLGSSYTSTLGDGLTLTGTGYTNDQLLMSIGNAPLVTSYRTYIQNKYVDVHARLNYTWEDKYILEVTGNRDGSSSFGPGRQFGNFYSAGANWIATEEKWLKNLLPSWISLIKLSSNYGTTGVQGGDYQYLSQWATGPSTAIKPLYNYNGISPLVPIHAVNQDYRWETDKQFNASFDLGLLNDRINMHLSIYEKRVNDQLAQLPTPAFTGFTGVVGNSAADVQNKGIELQLNATIVSSKDFSWLAGFNISHNQNRLLSFPGIENTSYYTQYKVGQPITAVYVLHYLGVDPQTGQRSYEDYNHDGLITMSGAPGSGKDDRYAMVDLEPKFTGGATTNLRYKQLSLGLSFSFAKVMTPVPYLGTPGSFNSNVPPDVFNNHWRKPGDVSPNPRFTTSPTSSDYNFASSDGSYTDGSYIRLNNVNIAYSLPDRLAKKLGVQNLSLMISMQNVLTFSKYPGIGPQLTFGSQPQPKIFKGEFKLTF